MNILSIPCGFDATSGKCRKGKGNVGWAAPHPSFRGREEGSGTGAGASTLGRRGKGAWGGASIMAMEVSKDSSIEEVEKGDD
eukprot:1159673-Pelagomonas_calceolata.AAC.6